MVQLSKIEEKQLAIILVIVATLAVSTSAILFRFSNSSPLVKAFWRLLFASVMIVFLMKLTGKDDQLQELKKVDFPPLILSGFFLSVHFASWVASLDLTSITSSVVLVDSSPLLVVIFSYLFLGEKVTTKQGIGIPLSFVGAVTIAVADFSQGNESLMGDFLAIIGAIALAGYLIIGRNARKRLGLFAYVLPVYVSASTFLFLFVLGSGAEFLILPPTEWIIFILLAIGPSILGHTLYNYSLRHLSAPVVSTAILGEPIGASLLGIAFFREIPSLQVALGASIVIFGIFLVLSSVQEGGSGNDSSPRDQQNQDNVLS